MKEIKQKADEALKKELERIQKFILGFADGVVEESLKDENFKKEFLDFLESKNKKDIREKFNKLMECYK